LIKYPQGLIEDLLEK